MTTRARILVLDDEPNIVITLSRALALEGYVADPARSISEAEQLLQKSHPDLGLFDVRLPDGDGILLLERLRSQGETFPIIMMSGHGTIDEAVRAIHLGAIDFLEKPIGQDRLLLTIGNALRMARLVAENQALRAEARQVRGTSEILGRSKVITTLKSQITRVAESEGRVLITGENGTGKELIAAAIHAASKRSDRPFVSLNCAAVPSELIESELFGHEKGAFTGAISRKLGKFERADQGTLFLDEVGDMPQQMQAKLLRVLQTGDLERVGGSDTVHVDVRVIAATNKDLTREIADGRFREDLYYRLNVVPIESPPLRERKEDLPILIDHFLNEACRRNSRRVPTLTDKAKALLASHDYPGNIRELRNLMERIVILAAPDAVTLDADDIRTMVPSRSSLTAASAFSSPSSTFSASSPSSPSSPGSPSSSFSASYRPNARLADMVTDAERSIIAGALEAHGGSVPEAARALGVERSNFHKKLKALGLK